MQPFRCSRNLNLRFCALLTLSLAWHKRFHALFVSFLPGIILRFMHAQCFGTRLCVEHAPVVIIILHASSIFPRIKFSMYIIFPLHLFLYQIWFVWIGRSALHFRKSSFFLPLTELPYISDMNCVNVTVALTYFLPRKMWNVKSKLLLHIVE